MVAGTGVLKNDHLLKIARASRAQKGRRNKDEGRRKKEEDRTQKKDDRRKKKGERGKRTEKRRKDGAIFPSKPNAGMRPDFRKDGKFRRFNKKRNTLTGGSAFFISSPIFGQI